MSELDRSETNAAHADRGAIRRAAEVERTLKAEAAPDRECLERLDTAMRTVLDAIDEVLAADAELAGEDPRDARARYGVFAVIRRTTWRRRQSETRMVITSGGARGT